MICWWQRQKVSLSLNVAGLLSCTSKDACNAPSLMKLDAVRQSFLHFLKDPESYGTKKSSGKTQKKFHLHCAGGSDGLSVKTQADPQPKLRPLLMLTAARETASAREGLQEQTSSKVTSPPMPQTCLFGVCKGVPNMGHCCSTCICFLLARLLTVLK